MNANKFLLFISIVMNVPQHASSSILLADDKGRSIDLPSNIQLHLTKEFSPRKFIHLNNLETATIEKFLHYINTYISITKQPFYPADAVEELTKINSTTSNHEFWQLFEMAHFFDAPAIAYALSHNYFKENRANKDKEKLLNPAFELSQPAQETLRKHYFLLTEDASVMSYKNTNNEDVTLMFTLQEITHVKRLEIQNAQFNLSGLFLSSIEGLQVPPTSVDHLDLSNNFLTELPHNFCIESSLKKLNLANNKIKKLPDSLGKLTQLEVLDISNNQLTTLPESINKLTNLWRFDAGSNNITELQESLCKCTQLRWLNLNNNKLSKLPENFIRLSNIDKLYLQHNDFTTIPKQLYLLPNLRILSIKNNNIKQLPQDAQLSLKSVKLDL